MFRIFAVSNRLPLRVSNGNNNSVVSIPCSECDQLITPLPTCCAIPSSERSGSVPAILPPPSVTGCRAHVTGIIYQLSKMYSAGVPPLKAPVKDYPGYTGMQKGLFCSVQLLDCDGERPRHFFLNCYVVVALRSPPVCV